MKATIVRAGFLTTVQDGTRVGTRDIGVATGGALDLFALQVLNVVVGNDPATAGLEIATGVVRLNFADRRLVAWGGGDYEVRVGEAEIPAGHPAVVVPGVEVKISGPQNGFRVWLAVSGGFDVPSVLGSRSTDLRGGFGGWQGRALSDGDVIPLGGNSPLTIGLLNKLGRNVVASWAAPYGWTQTSAQPPVLRFIPGQEWSTFEVRARERFLRDAFAVAPQSDRMGARLDGPELKRLHNGDLLSEPVAPGTIQVPASGNPILLLGDCQTIGGYAKIAHVITVDLPRAAQLRPADRVTFRQVSLSDAHVELRLRSRDFNIFRTGLGLTS